MNITIASSDREILLMLFKSNEIIDIYSFYEKLKLGPSHISSFLNKFDSSGIVVLENEKICLTEIGKKWIINNRHQLFLKKRNCLWKNIPSDWILDK